MKKELLLLFGFLIAVSHSQFDKSYECLKNVVQKMTNSSCPLITPEVEENIDDYARLYTDCLKIHYLINGCNETEWVQACTQRVANIPEIPSSGSLRGFQDISLMWKYCNKDVTDPDWECFENATTSFSKESCPELKNIDKMNLTTLTKLLTSCFKKLYDNYGCEKDQWIRVCNRRADRYNIAENGGQKAIDMFRSNCDINHDQ
uniref:DUF19 domain-containing protein n=1 Tax=Panagrolaimus sp. PS1159 TaxID=55785 RepID=A0AC35FZ32_9BILA